ncbi:DUF58 domain-containing protein [Natrinema altunense]|uniref:DUF58 domain-containing protein n=1 Tax=Natrinema altunense TaxID=222984 RepID=A0A482Y4Q0_9EURY|nr:DUF58 domain-containing protein [Natrinema altunense]RZH69184.1 DUF58 domain-containing protein [Natrinema altunense]
MRPTRVLWSRLSLAGFLAAFAVVIDRPLPLAGAVLVGAWVLASQYSFLAALERTTRRLSITRGLPSATVRAGESTPIPIDATLADPTPLSLEIDAGLPTAARADRDAATLTLEPDATAATTTVSVTWPVVGRHRFDAARVTATDGRFVETVATGERPTVSVESRGPRRLHVGEGGDRLASPYGAHALRRSGRGIEPAEIREHVPGDAAKRIDWKATARFATPHVREYETETTRRTLLVVDHGRSLSTGPPAATKLEYLREVMLATADRAQELDDPLGLVAVDDGGVTSRLEPAATAGTYAAVRRELLAVEPTPSDLTTRRAAEQPSRAPTQAADGGRAEPALSIHERPTRATARRSVRDLEGDADPFAEMLRPFYAASQRYRRLARDRVLFDAVETTLAASSSTSWVVIFTDDADPAALRETVSMARANDAAVTVFLAPTVLYEPGGLADIERATDRYREFEALRRDLARLDRVRAFEVGPGDRLATVLEAGRKRGDRR